MAIKIFTSEQLGAPVLKGAGGAAIDVLDAVLVNGYGQVSVASITRSGSTATVTTSTAHGLSTGNWAVISGADQAAYNVEAQVTVTSNTVFTYDVAGTPATPATGTITSKRASAGWTKPFAATNKAVYRSNDTTGNRYYYRVVDDFATTGGAKEARIRGYASMTDVDSGTEPFPTVSQQAEGYFIQKSNAIDATGRHWVVVTDGKIVYFLTYWGYATASRTLASVDGGAIGCCVFGDMLPFKAGDVYMACVSGSPNQNDFNYGFSGVMSGTSTVGSEVVGSNNNVIAFIRDYTGVTGPKGARPLGSGICGNPLGSVAVIAYPHPSDNGFYMSPVLAVQSSPSLIRGRIPGLYEPMQGRCFSNTQVVENVQGYAGRKFLFLYNQNGYNSGAVLFDMTGPWDS